MNNTYKLLSNLFLGQSYLDAWEDYQRSLRKSNFIKWDYVILTASNEAQAKGYREQIEYRVQNGLLPQNVRYEVLPDPGGKRVGSGGATFHVLDYIAQQEFPKRAFFDQRILVIHSGGDSKRAPQYSACGKLFSPVPRELPDGRGSTLFDEFMIAMSGVPSRMKEGMLVLSGDVLLLFNALQIDSQFDAALAISIKEKVEIGKNHGVFLNDGTNHVGKFLHKQSEESLKRMGAVNAQDCVDLDTGAVMLDAKLLMSLYGLISTNGKTDPDKFNEFVNETVQISFYGDFLYPLAKEATLEQYYKEACEGIPGKEITECRTKLWEVLHPYSMKLLSLSPAEFIHFGTTWELLNLVTKGVMSYDFLDWKKQVISNTSSEEYACHNAYIGSRAKIGVNAYLENSYILDDCIVGENSIVSGLKVRGGLIPSDVVWHGLKLRDGGHVVRVYGVTDNPKNTLEGGAGFLQLTLSEFMDRAGLFEEQVWDGEQRSLWKASLYPVADTMEEAVEYAAILCRIADQKASREEILKYQNSTRMSLYQSFNMADSQALMNFKRELEDRILSSKFLDCLKQGSYYKKALEVLGNRGITKEVLKELMNDAYDSDFYLKIRTYYAISRYMKEQKVTFSKEDLSGVRLEDSFLEEFNQQVITYDMVESLCFQMIQHMIFAGTMEEEAEKLHKLTAIRKEKVTVELPVRVNWGGGWTDTPPFCNEQGGVVLNAAIKINGKNPVCVTVRRLSEYRIEFESQDISANGVTDSLEEIQDCHNPYDPFALHKAALLACGVVPMKGGKNLQEILKALGGGIYLSTQVIGIPKGSGLGTSSILSGACVKALFEFFGISLSDQDIYRKVLIMEQLMSTGGGWQDQVGGITPGIKFITSRPGVHQDIHVEKVNLPEETKRELQERFALIYTGQRRLARNLLRDVVGSYIGAQPSSVLALGEMKRVAALMRFELEHGSVDGFAELLNRHWELSRQLDAGTSNTCIEQMLKACEDLTDAHFIAGAGGGGFLQVILKKGVSRATLNDRLYQIFQDSGVGLWECEFVS